MMTSVEFHYLFFKAAGEILFPPRRFRRIQSPNHSGSACTASQILVSFPIVYLARGKTAMSAWMYASITGVISSVTKGEVSIPFIISTTTTKVPCYLSRTGLDFNSQSDFLIAGLCEPIKEQRSS